jgi:hypothetical protein
MVRMSPQIGYTNPAPTEARTSRTGSRQPVGAPLSDGSCDNDGGVSAMQTGVGIGICDPLSVELQSELV